jgi:hypothetical protein
MRTHTTAAAGLSQGRRSDRGPEGFQRGHQAGSQADFGVQEPGRESAPIGAGQDAERARVGRRDRTLAAVLELCPQGEFENTPWQPLNATKGDVSRPAVMLQMAQTDFEFARDLERNYGWDDHGGHGGHGGHGRGCSCPGCSGTACAHCNDRGCAACNGGKPAPGLGVYPPQVMKGETITLVANAAMLAQGMPTEAKPGRKPDPNAPRIPMDSVDFYRDVDGDGLSMPRWISTWVRMRMASRVQPGGFDRGVPARTAELLCGAARRSRVPAPGATPEEMMAAAEKLDRSRSDPTAGRRRILCSRRAAGLSEEQSKGLAREPVADRR